MPFSRILQLIIRGHQRKNSLFWKKISNDNNYCTICTSHVLLNELIRHRVRVELISTLLRLVAMKCSSN